MVRNATHFLRLLTVLFCAGALRAAAPSLRSGILPLAFEENHGQADGTVRFLARTGGYTLQLRPSGATFTRAGTTSIAMSLVNANLTPRLTGVDQLPGMIHYFVGERSQWKANIP